MAKRWSELEDNAIIHHRDTAVVEKLTGRTHKGVRDRMYLMKGGRVKRKFPALHFCDEDFNVYRLSAETHTSVIKTRRICRSLVEDNEIPPPPLRLRVDGGPRDDESFDWKEGWTEKIYYRVVKPAFIGRIKS